MTMTRRMTATVAGLASLGLALGVWSFAQAQEQPAERIHQAPQAELRIGIMQPALAFQQWDGREEAMGKVQQIQQQAMAAQEAGDQAQLMALQNQFEQVQQEMVAGFERDLKEVLPGVARKSGVKVIAVNIAYSADDVETQDVTAQVVEELGGDPNAMQQQMLPGLAQ